MIFEDLTKRRWNTVVTLISATLTASFLMLLFTLAGVTIILPALGANTHGTSFHGRVIPTSSPAQTDVQGPVWFTDPTQTVPDSSPPAISLSSFIRNPERPYLITASLIQNEVNSINDYDAHKGSVDIVFPDWYFVTRGTCEVGAYPAPEITGMLKNSGSAIMPIVTNGNSGIWYTNQLHTVLRSKTLRVCIEQKIASLSLQAEVAGINLDFEGLTSSDRSLYLTFVHELSALLHNQGQALIVSIPANGNAFYDPRSLSLYTDGIMLIDKNSVSRVAEEKLFSLVPPNKIILAPQTGGTDTDLTDAKATPSLMTFSQASTLARDVGAAPTLNTTSGNMEFSYLDLNTIIHKVTFANAVTAWNAWNTAEHIKALGLSIWPTGHEDPSIWQFAENPAFTPQDLKEARALTNIDYRSTGEFFRVEELPQSGTLTLETDSNGYITEATYTNLPQGYLISRYGQIIGEKQLVLTFDDGPDPLWTPKILEILKKENVPATFFLVGQNVERYPELAKQEVENGFIIGNHTYTHPEVQEISKTALDIEITTAERIIQSTTGKSPVMMRVPRDVVTKPQTVLEASIYGEPSRLGYIIAGSAIDSEDWRVHDAERIVQTVEDALKANVDSHVLLFHDAGGNRSETVTALAMLIPKLKSEGYSFVSTAEAIGVSETDLNPLVTQNEQVFAITAGFIVRAWHSLISLISPLFFATTAIAFARIAFMGFVFFRSKKRTWTAKRNAPLPRVSVAIPAYNEEKTIENTIRSVAANTYPNYEMIVVNDGSTDGTSDVVKRLQESIPNLRLIEKTNGGKSEALNAVFLKSLSEIIVTIDADTILYPFTIEKLVKPFDDPSVDAVCGNVEVGNVHNILTGFQALEYITTQNFDRRAFDGLNCISVVPGATGAWRRERVLSIGGYESDTLTEDADISLKLLEHGGKIVYEQEARSKTEAPDTNAALAKQRFRWSFGTYQCLYKHRKSFFKGTLGWVALPNMFVFQVLFPILSPIGDLIFIISILNGSVGAIMAGYLLFLILDAVSALLAFSFERKSYKLAIFILIQRFYYRQFMYVIAFQSFLTILKGTRTGWKKIQRTGGVEFTPAYQTV